MLLMPPFFRGWLSPTSLLGICQMSKKARELPSAQQPEYKGRAARVFPPELVQPKGWGLIPAVRICFFFERKEATLKFMLSTGGSLLRREARRQGSGTVP